MTATRRLAAILAADVAGYSRLIGADEGATLRALNAVRAELIDPAIAAHNGRLVKTMDDGLLVEFSSVVDALGCATEVQAGLAERNAAASADKRIELRIGINVGDIVVEDGDIFGDGVNVAARLEALAQPGGICVSARVQEDAAGKLDLAFEDIGEQALKNITRPVRVYRVAMALHRRSKITVHRCTDYVGPGSIGRRIQFILDGEQNFQPVTGDDWLCYSVIVEAFWSRRRERQVGPRHATDPRQPQHSHISGRAQ